MRPFASVFETMNSSAESCFSLLFGAILASYTPTCLLQNIIILVLKV